MINIIILLLLIAVNFHTTTTTLKGSMCILKAYEVCVCVNMCVRKSLKFKPVKQ